MHALLATVGSVAGAAGTFWLGRKVGEAGLKRLVRPSTLKKVEQRVSQSAAFSVAALGLIPPPFPYTAFVLVSGAGRVNPWMFLTTLGGVRLLRFSEIEATLAKSYGRGILSWMQSPTFTAVVSVPTGLAIIGTIISGIVLYRSVPQRQTTAPSPLNPGAQERRLEVFGYRHAPPHQFPISGNPRRLVKAGAVSAARLRGGSLSESAPHR